MPYRLLKYGLSKTYREPRMFRSPEKLKDEYDVVIIGGGGHGLAAAYYLAKDHGIHNVAVLEKSYLGGGGTVLSGAFEHDFEQRRLDLGQAAFVQIAR